MKNNIYSIIIFILAMIINAASWAQGTWGYQYKTNSRGEVYETQGYNYPAPAKSSSGNYIPTSYHIDTKEEIADASVRWNRQCENDAIEFYNKKEYEKAFERLKDTKFSLSAQGYRMLGYLYEMGLGIPQDYLRAAEYYQKSADGGDQWGQAYFGTMLLNGLGIKQNQVEAVKWFQKSASNGCAYGQY